jgi:hypothetical protein
MLQNRAKETKKYKNTKILLNDMNILIGEILPIQEKIYSANIRGIFKSCPGVKILTIINNNIRISHHTRSPPPK